MKLRSTYNGTGAVVYLCFGFIPDWFRQIALEDSDCAQIDWSPDFRAAEMVDGVITQLAANTRIPKTHGAGVEPYAGGEVVTAAMQTSTAYGEGVFLVPDATDYKAVDVSAAGSILSRWTASTTVTGAFNVACALGYIGEGSIIQIDGQRYLIEAISSNGEQTGEVTLDRAAPSGKIEYISGMYGMKPAAVGTVTPAGIKQNLTAILNVNDEIQYVEAQQD